jgi:hypothetical protein
MCSPPPGTVNATAMIRIRVITGVKTGNISQSSHIAFMTSDVELWKTRMPFTKPFEPEK